MFTCVPLNATHQPPHYGLRVFRTWRDKQYQYLCIRLFRTMILQYQHPLPAQATYTQHVYYFVSERIYICTDISPRGTMNIRWYISTTTTTVAVDSTHQQTNERTSVCILYICVWKFYYNLINLHT